MDPFLAKLALCLETDEVSPDALLRSFEVWDSLTALSIISMVQRDYRVALSADDLRAVSTPNDLWALIQGRGPAI
jgi:acyl carrier protein